MAFMPTAMRTLCSIPTRTNLRRNITRTALARSIFQRQGELQLLPRSDRLLQVHHHQMVATGREADTLTRRQVEQRIARIRITSPSIFIS